MKKNIIIGLVGLAGFTTASFGQGYVFFSSYLANGNTGATTTIFGSSTLVPSGYTAALYYAVGTVSDSVNNTLATSISSDVTGLLPANFTQAYATGVATAGYFDNGSAVTIPGYVSGPITFEVVAYNGADYDSSTIRGRSGSFTMNSIATSLQTAIPTIGDNGQPLPNFFVATVVPEPSTLALAGLGGLGMLLAFRRKKA